MKLFLQCVASQERHDWAEVKNVEDDFISRVGGSSGNSLFLQLILEATTSDLVAWRDLRCRDAIVRDPNGFTSVRDALLQLTRAGQSIAGNKRRSHSSNGRATAGTHQKHSGYRYWEKPTSRSHYNRDRRR